MLKSVEFCGNSLLGKVGLKSAITRQPLFYAVKQAGKEFLNGHMADITMRAKLRGLKDTTGQPVFRLDMQTGSDRLKTLNGGYYAIANGNNF